MCSTFNVSKSTLHKIMQEVRRGQDCSLALEVRGCFLGRRLRVSLCM